VDLRAGFFATRRDLVVPERLDLAVLFDLVAFPTEGFDLAVLAAVRFDFDFAPCLREE